MEICKEKQDKKLSYKAFYFSPSKTQENFYVDSDRVAKFDVTKNKIFEIMGWTEIFWKYMTKNAYLPEITILLQFGDEILALSCSNDSIQILVIL